MRSPTEQRLGCLGLAEVEQMLDEHAERGAPVADVVLARDRVAPRLEHSDERVADRRRPQMADMHLLGDVRCRVVDHDLQQPFGRLEADAVAGRDRRQLSGEER